MLNYLSSTTQLTPLLFASATTAPPGELATTLILSLTCKSSFSVQKLTRNPLAEFFFFFFSLFVNAYCTVSGKWMEYHFLFFEKKKKYNFTFFCTFYFLYSIFCTKKEKPNPLVPQLAGKYFSFSFF